MPHERTRAVIQTHEFLKQLERDLSVSEEMRGMANQLLRHYPSRGEVLLQGLLEEKLLVKFPTAPFFSSTLTYQPTALPPRDRLRRKLCEKLAAILLSCSK
ncbi:BPSL0761 family protein [Pseudomonas sp. BN414]|uniref:BPSL0761 family protein n=1 Tax=Pseudomonas sp. BN414 TaxID=2567888 RepID=UPI0032AE8E60